MSRKLSSDHEYVSTQSHLGIMIGVLVFTIAGLVLILVHASGRWLSSTVSKI